MDMILNKPFFTCHAGKKNRNHYYTELLDDMVARSPEEVCRDLLDEHHISPLSESEERLFRGTIKYLLNLDPIMRNMFDFLYSTRLDDYKEDPTRFEPYIVDSINTNFNSKGVVETIRWIHTSYFKIVPLIVISDAMDLFIQRAYLFKENEYQKAAIACVMVTSMIHDHLKNTTNYTTTPKDPNVYLNVYLNVYDAIGKISNRWPLQFESLYSLTLSDDTMEENYIDIVTTDKLEDYIKSKPSVWLESK